jgi:hypothetical protein
MRITFLIVVVHVLRIFYFDCKPDIANRTPLPSCRDRHGQCVLAKLTFNGGRLVGKQTVQQKWEHGKVVTIDITMTEADFSGRILGAAGAQILAAFMSTKLFKAKGALKSLDITGNCTGSEHAYALKQICAAKAIACEVGGNETEDERIAREFELERDREFEIERNRFDSNGIEKIEGYKPRYSRF